VGWTDWLLVRAPRKVADFGSIGHGRVELSGTVEALGTLSDPLDGSACIAIEYRAAPPSQLGIQGPEQPFSAFRVEAHQALEFVLTDGARRVLVQIPPGQDDVAAVHSHLTLEYGVRLKAATRCIRSGDRLHVVGVAEEALSMSPYRAPSYAAILRAERFWAAEATSPES